MPSAANNLLKAVVISVLVWIIIVKAAVVLNIGQSAGGGAEDVTTIATVSCIPPNIRVGGVCCLDADGNRICDKNEPPSKPATSTTSTSTSSTTLSTIPVPPIACRVNKDCGYEKHEKICYKDNVHVKTETPFCLNPGTTSSRCLTKITGLYDTLGNPTPYQVCGNGCLKGECR